MVSEIQTKALQEAVHSLSEAGLQIEYTDGKIIVQGHEPVKLAMREGGIVVVEYSEEKEKQSWINPSLTSIRQACGM